MEGFDFESTAPAEVQMGTMVEEDILTVTTASENEVKDENEVQRFLEFAVGKPCIIFDKDSIRPFMDMLAYQSRLGFDQYTLSFKLDVSELQDKQKINMVYNNGNVMAFAEVPVRFQGEFVSQIVSIDTLLRVFSASKGYLFLYLEEGLLYSYIFGGKVYVETFQVKKDICSREHLMSQLSSTPVKTDSVSSDFIGTLKNLYDLVKSGTRVEEKAIYFRNEFVYIFAGAVLGRFPGVGIELTLQSFDISTISKLFSDVKDSLIIEDHDIFIKIEGAGRSVYLAKRKIQLTDDMKFTEFGSPNYVKVDLAKVNSIVSFLIGMSNNSGSLEFAQGSNGLNLVCFQKALDYKSNFPIEGEVSGSGIGSVKVSLDFLKSFLKSLSGEIVVKTMSGKLYVSDKAGGDLVIFGEEVR